MDNIRYRFKFTIDFKCNHIIFLDKMSDKPDRFLCGYLVKDKDGILKQVDLKDNGGARVCQITRDNMNFNEIHNRLRKIFLEGNIKNT